jgi:stage II sporulation protein GA (sporulation sigma-E factor processing peptidase)
MAVEIYGDLLFLINLGMDALCLYLTGRLLHRRLSHIRIWVASALGGFYSVAALLMDTGQAVALLTDIAVCLAMCAISFGCKGSEGLRRFLGTALLYFILSMALGGIMTALYHLLNKLEFRLPADSEGEGMEAWLFALLALPATLLSLWSGRVCRRAASVPVCTVEIEVGGRSVMLEGMVDTGNLLREPMSGRAVLCADASLLPRLPAELAEGLRLDALSEATARRGSPYRLRLIPAATAEGTGLLAGFIPDRITLRWMHRGKEKSQSVDAVVAVSHHLQGVQLLVPAELIG